MAWIYLPGRPRISGQRLSSPQVQAAATTTTLVNTAYVERKQKTQKSSVNERTEKYMKKD